MTTESELFLAGGKMDGVALIAEERKRQVAEEGYNDKHDDDFYHSHGELAWAAVCYAAPLPVAIVVQQDTSEPGSVSCIFVDPWPAKWERQSDKRIRDQEGRLVLANLLPIRQQIRNFVKAGALIAAEIDRLCRRETL